MEKRIRLKLFIYLRTMVCCILILTLWQAAYAVEKGISFAGSKRLSLMYGINQVSDIKSDNIEDFDRADGYSVAYEVGMPFSVFANVHYYQNKEVEVVWRGTANTPVEFYGYMVDLGAKATLPLGFFQPWIGAGYGWGVLTFSNPRDRDTDNIMIAIYSRGSRSVQSPLGVGGIDISLGTAGIRVAYMQKRLKTKKSSYIGDEPYDMTMASVLMGFWVNM